MIICCQNHRDVGSFLRRDMDGEYSDHYRRAAAERRQLGNGIPTAESDSQVDQRGSTSAMHVVHEVAHVCICTMGEGETRTASMIGVP